jgi:hypothetical protein
MSARSPTLQRVRQRHIDWLTERLSPRDWRILEFLRISRLLTGSQLERLAFTDLGGRSRSVVRWRVLKRLVDWRVLVPLNRRIGGAARGSAGMAYALDSAGLALIRFRTAAHGAEPRIPRRPGLPGERFLRHVLTVSELYVQLVEASRGGGFELVEFRAEPDAWHPDGLGGWLKPDAYVLLAYGDVEDCWAIEVDKATEHLPTIRHKVETYLDFMQRGQLGPHGMMPRVLLTVPDDSRQAAIQSMLDHVPSLAENLFRVVVEDRAIPYLLQVLRQ